MKRNDRIKRCFGNCKKKNIKSAIKQDERFKEVSVPDITLYGEGRKKGFRAEKKFALETNVSEIGLLVVRKPRTTEKLSAREDGNEEDTTKSEEWILFTFLKVKKNSSYKKEECCKTWLI